MCVVVAAAAVADMSAADAWLQVMCLQAAAGVGVFAKCQVPCTQHILHCATPPAATTKISSNINGCLGLSQVVGTTLIGIPAILPRPHG